MIPNRTIKLQQTGVALIIGLVFLLLMTLMGTHALRSSSMQERISTNLFERNLAFQAAESAILDGETQLAALSSLPTTTADCDEASPCILSYDPTLNLAQQSESWWQSHSNVGTMLPNLTTAPRYVIQYLETVGDDITLGFGPSEGNHFYSITARGQSGQDAAQTIISSSYTRRH